MQGSEDIIFTGAFGPEDKEVKISVYWVDTWYLFVDNRLVSLVLLRDDKWFLTEQGKDFMLTGADALILGEIIESSQR